MNLPFLKMQYSTVSYTKLSSNGADDKNCLIYLISESLQYP